MWDTSNKLYKIPILSCSFFMQTLTRGEVYCGFYKIGKPFPRGGNSSELCSPIGQILLCIAAERYSEMVIFITSVLFSVHLCARRVHFEVKDVFFSREDLFKRKCSQTVSELSKANIAQEWCDTFLRPLAYVFIGVVYWVSEGFYGIARCCFSICVPGKLVFHGAFMEHICMDNL